MTNEYWEVNEDLWEAEQELLAEQEVEEDLRENPRPYPTEEEMEAMALAYGEA